MRVPPENWLPALEWLPRWEDVSPAARLAFLSVKPTPGSALLPAPAAQELVQAGLMYPPGPKGKQHRVEENAKPLLRVLRAMHWVPLGAVRNYIAQHLTNEHVSLLCGDRGGYVWGSRAGELEERVSSVEWIQALLDLPDADAARRWEAPRRADNEPFLLADPWTLAALQRLVVALKDHLEGVPLRQVPQLLPDVEPRYRAGALAAGARYLFLFPTVRKDGMEAWVGLLPAVAQRMGPPPPPPAPVQAADVFEAPFRLLDMTAVLVEAATEPIPVRASDYALYARAQKMIASRLAHLPAWAGDLLVTPSPEEDVEEDEEPVEDRITSAVGVLSSLKLMQLRSTGGRHRFSATRQGERWLAMGEGERLKEILDAFRASTQRAPGSLYGSNPAGVDFFGARFNFTVDAGKLDLRKALADAFLSVPRDAMVPLSAFAAYHGRERNPLLRAGFAGRRDRWSSMPVSRERWESAWASLLVAFLQNRLVAFGGARLGLLADDRMAFGLTDAGRYLLGAADSFELAPEPGGEVVVQPDFEIVFLAPAARAEAELGRIAERTGSGVGALFRLTRASVLRAAEQGMTAEQLVKTLQQVSRSGVPDNVARQVRDWMKAVRTIRIAPAVLVDCPDAETAGRVRAMGGAHVTQVTPTLLRLDADAKTRAALVKRLRDKGIFVGTGPTPAADDAGPAPGRRGRARR